ncbi:MULTISPECIES: DUF3298 and DUF4163 domain-containing protein [Gracilibacillus]|uniref:DUF3298 and DUF4163 domain-containing protein n=1 Tax=Gracilibacillus TaxID=74385 RepID=UPI0008268E44|nr:MULTISPECIES: DUF3298 and DUF4163 domain-containing protein [Gracilibacillus]
MKKRILVMAALLFFVCHASVVMAQDQTALVTDQLFKDKVELKYPQVSEMDNQSFEGKINGIFEQYIKQSYKEMRNNEKEAEQYDFHAEYQTDYQVKYNQASLLSILTSNYMFSGGAHGNTVVQSFNFDEKAKKRVYVTDILNNEEKIEAVRDYVWEYAIARPDVFYPDLKREDIPLTQDTAFYFGDDGITLVFQQYAIAPYVSGNQEIFISKEVYEGK